MMGVPLAPATSWWRPIGLRCGRISFIPWDGIQPQGALAMDNYNNRIAQKIEQYAHTVNIHDLPR